MLKNTYASCLCLSPAISSQFNVEMCAAFKNCKKNSQKQFLGVGVHGRLRSSVLTNLKSLSPVLVIISSMSVPICNRFRTKRANNVKITSFRGTPFDALVRGEPPHPGERKLVTKN